MIKIKLKENKTVLSEASIRGLMQRYRITQEFAEWVNNDYRQNADTLLQLFTNNTSIVEDDQHNRDNFTHFLNYYGDDVDEILKKYPSMKESLVEMQKGDFYDFQNFIKTITFRMKIPSDWIKQIKTAYRDDADALIDIYSAMHRFHQHYATIHSVFYNFMTGDGEKILAALKKFPHKKHEFVKKARGNSHDLMIEIEEMLNSAEDKERVIMELDNDFVWVDLQTGYCSREAKRMGHCGQASYDGTLYSLRRLDLDSETGGDEPYVTIEMNDQHVIHQIKGPNNSFPNRSLWDYIYKFFEHFKIKKDQIREPLALDNDEFMSPFEEPYNFDDSLKRLKELAKLEDTYENNKEHKSIMNRIMRDKSLSTDQLLQVFEEDFYRSIEAMKPVAFAIEDFFHYYQNRDLDFNVELLTKIFDYLEQSGEIKTLDTIQRFTSILAGRFKIYDIFATKYHSDQVIGKYVKYLENLPLMDKLKDVSKRIKDKEEKKEIKEHRRNLATVKFKRDHRGHFRL